MRWLVAAALVIGAPFGCGSNEPAPKSVMPVQQQKPDGIVAPVRFACPEGQRGHPALPPSAMPTVASSSPTGPKKVQVVQIAEHDTDIRGRLPPEVIKRLLRAHFPYLRRCYERALRKHGESFQGTVVSDFVIGTDGATGSALARPHAMTLPDDEMIECVAKVFACLEFPAPAEGKVAVHYPLHFSAFEELAVELSGTRLKLNASIRFDGSTATLDPRSDTALDAVAELLKAEGKDIELLEVGAHVDTVADEKLALELSEARATAVVQALVARGIDATRLRSHGYGRACPSGSQNRVELTIVKRAGVLTDATLGCKGVKP
jgi:outer membrane protein OmpA-like peptidoglycan-associated protein